MKRASAFAVLWVYATQLAAGCGSSVPPWNERLPAGVRHQAVNATPPTVASDTVLSSQLDWGVAAGTTVGQASVTSEGTARYTFPLWTPPGRAGVEPRLALTYSSDSANGPLGMGWNLSGLSRINRCRKTEAHDGGPDRLHFDASDRFCLDGQRLVLRSGTHGADGAEYRTERDLFARIVSVGTGANGPATFKMYTKEGLILTFGGEGSSTQTQGARTLTWALSRIEDRNGNFLTVSYDLSPAGDEQLPVEIRYTGSTVPGAPPALANVLFQYEQRTDAVGGFTSGFSFRQSRRLKRIEMRGSTGQAQMVSLLRSYTLTYTYDGLPAEQDGSAAGASVLTQATECDGFGHCRKPFVFTYARASYQSRTDSFLDYAQTTDSLYPGGYTDLQSFLAADVNGDGRDDLVYRKRSGTTSVLWFVRYSDGSSFGPEQAMTSLPVPSSTGESTTDGRFTDWDGDGLLDFIVSTRNGSQNQRTFHLLKNSGNGTFNLEAQENEVVSVRRSFWTMDQDGDGLVELLRAVGNPAGGSTLYYFGFRPGPVNSGAPYTIHQPETWIAPATPGFPMDLEGTGRTGLLLPAWDFDENGNPEMAGDNYWYLGLNADGTRDMRQTSIVREDKSSKRYLFVDVNRDGLTDLVSYPQAGGDPVLLLNTGVGFVQQAAQTFEPFARIGPSLEYLNPPPEGWGSARNSLDNGVRVVDINADGLQDIVLMDLGLETEPYIFSRSKAVVMLSQGSSFVPATLPMSIGSTSPDRGMYRSLTLDMNGDGMTDFVQPNHSGTLNLWLRQGKKPFLLLSVTDAMGARTEFDYAPITNPAVYTKGTGCQYPRPCVRQGMWLTSELRRDAGDGHPLRRITFQYEDARMDAVGRGLLGVTVRTVTDHATGTVTRETYDLSTRVASRYPLARRMLHRTIRTLLPDGSTRQRETVVTPAYVERPGADGTSYFALYTLRMSEREYDVGQPTLWSVMRTVEDFDPEYGNVRAEKWEWSDGYVSRRDSVYENRAVPWLVGLPMRITETSTTAQGVTRTRTQGFTHAQGTGLLTDEFLEPDSVDADLYLATHYDYTPEGLPLTVTKHDRNGTARTTTSEYDATTRTFTSAIINAAGHRRMTAWHPGLGVPAEEVDVNGVRRRWQYDGFGRLRTEDGPTSSDVSVEYLRNTVRTVVAGNGEETLFLDQLGRVSKRQTLDFAGNPIEEAQLYDAAGRVVEVQRPSPAGGAALARTRFQHDALGRLTRITLPDNTFRTMSYSGLLRTETDERGHATTTEVNGRGWPFRVSEPNPAGGLLTTTFEYGPFGTRVASESVGRRTTTEYDVLGRPTRVVDPSTGASVMRYNAFGELRQSEDALAQQQTFTHDALGRLIQVQSPVGQTTFTWDSAPNGAGVLAGTTSADGISTAYAYDSLGRRIQEATQVDGALYAFDSTYDAHGRLRTLSYPAVSGSAQRFQVLYGYTARGDLLDVRNATSQALYWQVGARVASGQLSHAILGNGVESHYRYDDMGSVRLIETGLGTSDLQRLLYAYDAGGNLTSRHDALSESSEDFGYDALGRLTRWTAYQNCGRSIIDYTYSPDGNLTGRLSVEGGAPSETYVYGQNGAPPHALTQGPAGTYGYDARGFRVTSPGGTQVEYSPYGQPRGIQRSADVLTFQYDAFDARVRKMRSNGDSTLTVGGGLYEKRVEGGVTRHLFSVSAGSQAVSVVTLAQQGTGPLVQGVTYLHRDLLGSVEAHSDDQGALVTRLKYDPFGRRVFPHALSNPSAPVPRGGVREGFTGHLHDDELGLVYMEGRVYDPGVARFLTPDPFVQAPHLSQSHNRYSYVWNNPLRYTDPTGYATNTITCGATPDEGCGEYIQVGDTTPDPTPDPTIYGPYIGWQNDTWNATGPDYRRRGPGRITAGNIAAMSPREQRAFFRDNGGVVPVNLGTDELEDAQNRVNSQFYQGMADVMLVVSGAAGTNLAAAPAMKQATLAATRATETSTSAAAARVAAREAKLLKNGPAGVTINWPMGRDVAAKTAKMAENLTAKDVAAMRSAGLTRATVKNLRLQYEMALEHGGKKLSGNDQLLPRLRLMERIDELWPK
ncbi:RHS repeat-associated core domain-containing protein [Myxococcus sp. CA039A]|uniref:RHS repeat-associated core domain-containing protein n=1 Tax=Myxococcus sp. CA039A TaxID=2741737 RepID=UPI00157A727B|nr:RHS repeat-associated core domain-containing protein [Myxococcus sp. CA039A]NTX54358.1 VCBS repeat-containing protein [Myxococcus sp. CA039A]